MARDAHEGRGFLGLPPHPFHDHDPFQAAEGKGEGELGLDETVLRRWEGTEGVPHERVVQIRSHWTRHNLWVLGAMGIGVLYVAGQGTVTHQALGETALGLIVGVLLAAAMWLGATFAILTRRVELTNEAVSFVVGFTTTKVAWGDLVPPRDRFFITMTFKYRVDGKVREDDPMGVTKEQARAILAHPSCPKFNLDRATWASVGLAPR